MPTNPDVVKVVWAILIAAAGIVAGTIGAVSWLDGRIDTRIAETAAKPEFLRNRFETLEQRAASVPAGAVMAFDLPRGCPSGWTEDPRFSGRVVVAAGNGAGLTPRTFGDRAGQETYQLDVTQMPRHRHNFETAQQVVIHTTQATERYGINGAGTGAPEVAKGQTGFEGGGSDGKSKPYDVMPPFIALQLCRRI